MDHNHNDTPSSPSTMSTFLSTLADDSSPRSMAKAALDQAMAEKNRQDPTTTTTFHGDNRSTQHSHGLSLNDSFHFNNNNSTIDEELEQYKRDLDQAWREVHHADGTNDEPNRDTRTNNNNKRKKPLEKTIQILQGQVEELVQCGLQAFHSLDSTTSQLKQMTKLHSSSQKELARLRSAQEDSQATIANLLRAVEQSKVTTRDSSRVASIEAKLRSDVSNLRSERDEALMLLTDSNRKIHILQEQVRHLQAKVGRVTQEKIKLERDSRAAISLAKNLDVHVSSVDLDFYKRKVAELNDHLQDKNTLILEQQQEIENLKSLLEHSESQKRAGGNSTSREGKRGRKK